MTPTSQPIQKSTGRVVLRDSRGSGKTVTWTVRRGSAKRSDYLPSSTAPNKP